MYFLQGKTGVERSINPWHIINQMFGNQTHSNSIRLNWQSECEFGNQANLNTELCVSSIIFQTNQT